MGGSTGPYQNPPYANAYAFSATTSRRCGRWRPASPSTVSRSIRPTTAATGPPSTPNFKQGRIQQWSLNVEQQLPFSTIGSVAYAGTYGDRLFDKTPQPQHRDAGTGLQPGGPPSLSAAAGGHRRPQPRLDEVQLAADAARAAHHRRPLPARGLHLCQGHHQRRVRLRRRPGHRLFPGRRRRRRRRRIGQHRPAPQLLAQRAVPAAVVQRALGGDHRGRASAAGASTDLRRPQRLPARA